MNKLFTSTFIYPLLLLFSCSDASREPPETPTDLVTEYLYSPLGIGTLKPRFSWLCPMSPTRREQVQTAYEIVVSEAAFYGTDESVKPGTVVWQYKETTNRTINVVYDGLPLHYNQVYVWKVRWCDSNPDNTNSSGWSNWSAFSTGLEKWTAQWIGRSAGATISHDRPLQIRGEFHCPEQVQQALVYVAGLGYYQLFLNGHRIDNHTLGAFTVYPKRVLYDTFLVTASLQPDSMNAIGVRLAPGAWGQFYNGPLMLRLEMHLLLSNGSTVMLVSHAGPHVDGDTIIQIKWRTHDDPCIKADFYNGEQYDARLEQDGWNTPNFDDSHWETAHEVEHPVGDLTPNMMAPIRRFDEIKPLLITEPILGVYVFDFGQNMAGVEILRVNGPPGTTVTIYKGELLFGNGTVNNQLIGHTNMTTVYTLRGDHVTEVYEPSFAYYGFRYAQVTGFPGKPTSYSLSARFIHSDLISTGSIDFHNETSVLHGVQHCVRWSAFSNLMSIPTDCPNREKRGWMGDGQVSAPNALWNFNMAAFYTNWVRSMRDQQQIYATVEEIAGMVTDIVPDPAPPTKKAFTDATWSSAYLLIPLYLYQHYGDIRLIEEMYDGFNDYVVYLDMLARQNSSAPGGLLTKHKYGDWCNTYPRSTEIPITGPISASFFQITDYEIFAQFARLLNRSEDAEKYVQMANKLKPVFHELYYNDTAGGYVDGTQTPNVLALTLNAIPPDNLSTVVNAFIHDVAVKHSMHLTTGAVGTRFLLQALTMINRSDVAFFLVTQTSEPSWGWWYTQGATTLWENWSGVSDLTHPPPPTHNHIFLGSHWPWIYETFVGITQAVGSTAFEHIIIRPFYATLPLATWKIVCVSGGESSGIFDIDGPTGVYRTLRGRLSVTWSKASESALFSLTVIIPANSDAQVWVPTQNYCRETPSLNRIVVLESGHKIWAEGKFLPNDGITAGHYNEDFQAVVFQVGSGLFLFEFLLV